jgi:Lar family restriction alleviation protein
MTPEQLKPCPFCGGEAEIKDMRDNRIHIKCFKCLCQFGEVWNKNGGINELIKAWNKRSKLNET